MNNYKFRGKLVTPIDPDDLIAWSDWVKDGWVYGYLIGKDVIVGEVFDFEEDYFNTEFWCKVRPETVGQAIGLMDIQGKSIFEGDIIKLKYYTSYENYKRGEFKLYAGYVSYIVGSSWYVLLNSKGEIIDLLNRVFYPEIIGNIHDNPELLKP